MPTARLLTDGTTTTNLVQFVVSLYSSDSITFYWKFFLRLSIAQGNIESHLSTIVFDVIESRIRSMVKRPCNCFIFWKFVTFVSFTKHFTLKSWPVSIYLFYRLFCNFVTIFSYAKPKSSNGRILFLAVTPTEWLMLFTLKPNPWSFSLFDKDSRKLLLI